VPGGHLKTPGCRQGPSNIGYRGPNIGIRSNRRHLYFAAWLAATCNFRSNAKHFARRGGNAARLVRPPAARDRSTVKGNHHSNGGFGQIKARPAFGYCSTVTGVNLSWKSRDELMS
jgi:hypothetical protein